MVVTDNMFNCQCYLLWNYPPPPPFLKIKHWLKSRGPGFEYWLYKLCHWFTGGPQTSPFPLWATSPPFLHKFLEKAGWGDVSPVYNTLWQTLLASDPTGIPAPFSLLPPLQSLKITNINVPRFPYMNVLVVRWHSFGQGKKKTFPTILIFYCSERSLKPRREKESKTLKLNTNEI